MHIRLPSYRFYGILSFSSMIRSAKVRSGYVSLPHTSETAAADNFVVGFIGFHPTKRHLEVGIYYLLTYLSLFARSEHRPLTKERHCFLSVAIFSISFRVYPISFVSFSVSLCQVFRGLPLLLFPGGFHVMA